MKTAKITSAISTLSLVLFLSVASYANSGSTNSGDLPNSGDKSLAITSTSEKNFNYLRFDVTKYMNENEEAVLDYNSLDYIRFDINNYMNQTESIELPIATELDYIRFDVNNFTKTNSDNYTELPVNEFDYLSFDVNNYTSSASSEIDEMPVT